MSSPSADLPGSRQTRGEWMRTQRMARGWSIPEMRRHLREAAREAGDTLPENQGLGVMIRRWEKGEGGVSERYRLHYCRALGIPFDGFGTAPPPAGANIRLLAQAVTTPAARTGPLDKDERAELARLRWENADLIARHRQFTRDLMTWICKAMDVG